jgi:hypothetical protein
MDAPTLDASTKIVEGTQSYSDDRVPISARKITAALCWIERLAANWKELAAILPKNL